MRATYFYLLVTFFVFDGDRAFSQTRNAITIGTVDSLHSDILHEKRKIWVHVPSNATSQRYPVVYLLDGDQHFFSVQGIIQQLSSVNGNTLLPEMIVVGIPNTDRTRDLTPTHADSGPIVDSDFVKTSGGGELFLSFIEKELIPHIDSLYPTAPYRIFIGHSLGGLLAIHALVHRPQLFNAYIAIDPSMWWDNQKLIEQTKSGLKPGSLALNGTKLFLAMANTMHKSMDTINVQKDSGNATIHIRSIIKFGQLMKARSIGDATFTWKYYADDDHGSVPMIATYDGLRSLFSFYQFKLNFSDFLNPHFSIDSSIRVHFKNISKQMGYEISPQEALVKEIATALMTPDNYKRAYQLFSMNVEHYPSSILALKAMREYYIKVGDQISEQAIFKKINNLEKIKELKNDYLDN